MAAAGMDLAPVATLILLLLGLLWVIMVKTRDGVIVLKNVPKDAEILIDGGKISFTWPGGGKPVEVRAVPGQHKLEVKKDGFKTFGKEVTFKAGDSEEVTVRLNHSWCFCRNRMQTKSQIRSGGRSAAACGCDPG